MIKLEEQALPEGLERSEQKRSERVIVRKILLMKSQAEKRIVKVCTFLYMHVLLDEV